MALTSTSAYSVLNQEPSWRSFGCPNSTVQWRFLPDGSAEVDGKGSPKTPWPTKVDQWQELIAAAAIKWGVPAAWIAAVMVQESGGESRVGLMQVEASTASALEGRTITKDDLINDPALSIDLGTKYLRQKLDYVGSGSTCKPGAGDFVKAAVGYNAGCVKCASATSSGSVGGKGGESCPPTAWGVIMGCTRRSPDPGWCTPSIQVPGMFNCPTMYPLGCISNLNTAISRGWGDLPPGYDPNYIPPEPVPPYLEQLGHPERFLWLVGAGVVGYLGVRYLPRYLRRRMAYR